MQKEYMESTQNLSRDRWYDQCRESLSPQHVSRCHKQARGDVALQHSTHSRTSNFSCSPSGSFNTTNSAKVISHQLLIAKREEEALETSRAMERSERRQKQALWESEKAKR